MSERIEMVQGVDDLCRITFRAKRIVRHSPSLLAEALGVEENGFVLRIDPAAWEAANRLRRRRQGPKTAEEASFDDYHGHRPLRAAA